MDSADEPTSEDAADARVYVERFRKTNLPPGAEWVQTQSRKIMLDDMTDKEAIFVAEEFLRMEKEALTRRRARDGKR